MTTSISRRPVVCRFKVPHRPGATAMTRHNALSMAKRVGLSPADKWRIGALSFPIEYQAFWTTLADMGMSQQCLMDRMGASP